jgi:hypothetical protein
VLDSILRARLEGRGAKSIRIVACISVGSGFWPGQLAKPFNNGDTLHCYRYGDIAMRKRLATARPPGNAGMNLKERTHASNHPEPLHQDRTPDAIAAMKQFSEALLCSTCGPDGDVKAKVLFSRNR